VLLPASDLRRVLHNLLDNAMRHTRLGGTIVLDDELVGQTVQIGVTDECGGIPESDVARVFDASFRGDTARTRDNGGGGLGLAIATRLLEARIADRFRSSTVRPDVGSRSVCRSSTRDGSSNFDIRQAVLV
jgi:signal transduction histidine kinase